MEYSPERPNEDETACSAVYRKGTVKGSYERPGAVSRKKIRVGLKGRGNVRRCNPWSGGMETEAFYYDAGTGYVWGSIFLEEDEMVILCMSGERESEPLQSLFSESFCPVILHRLTLEEFCPDKEGELSFLRSGFRKIKEVWNIDKKLSGEPKKVGRRGEKQQALELTGLLREGRNELEIQVVSNLYNKVFPGNKKEQRLPSVYLPGNYGIWETDYKKVQLKILRYL